MPAGMRHLDNEVKPLRLQVNQTDTAFLDAQRKEGSGTPPLSFLSFLMEL